MKNFKLHKKNVDEALLKNISKVEYLESYLKSKFGLSRGVYPHDLVF